MTDLPKCDRCRHAADNHGDRAITPCMGGISPIAELLPVTYTRCACAGYRLPQRKRRKTA